MSDDEPNIHPTENITTPQSETIAVDLEMVPVVQAIWDLGLRTLACCQDSGEYAEAARDTRPERTPTGQGGWIEYFRGWAWLKMPVDDTIALVNALARTSLAEPATVRWKRGSWRLEVPMLYAEDTGAVLARAVQIHLPRTQLSELLEVLPTIGEGVSRARRWG